MIVNGEIFAKSKTLRSGAVPISRDEHGRAWLLLAKHPSGDLGDFGGGVKKGETCLDAAKREIEEETNGLSDEMISPNFDYDSAVGIIHKNLMAIIFIPVDPKWLVNARPRFLELTQQRQNNEIVDIVWVEETDLDKMVFEDESRPKTYPRWRPSFETFPKAESRRRFETKRKIEDSYFRPGTPTLEPTKVEKNFSSNEEPVLWRKVRMFLGHFPLEEVFRQVRY